MPPSRRENAWDYGLTTEEVRWFLDRYTPDAFDRAHPYAYPPSRVGTLSNLPPATVCTAEFDPPRADGVPTAAYHYDDTIHGFLSMVSDPDVEPVREALSDASAALRDAFDE